MFAKTKQICRETNAIFFKLTCDPAINLMDHSDLNVINLIKKSIILQRV